jgi:hypothetical protein
MSLPVAGALVLATALGLPVTRADGTAGPPAPVPAAIRALNVADDLRCAVELEGQPTPFKGGNACGTLVFVDGRLFTPQPVPDFVAPGEPTITNASSGSGTADDPFVIENVRDVGVLRLTEADTFVVGADHYDTRVSVRALDGADHAIVLYRGIDCFAGTDDASAPGLGELAVGEAACLATQTDGTVRLASRTLAPHAGEDRFSDLWPRVAEGEPLGDVCTCATPSDNAIALSWSLLVGEGARSVTLRTSFAGTMPPVPPQPPPPPPPPLRDGDFFCRASPVRVASIEPVVVPGGSLCRDASADAPLPAIGPAKASALHAAVDVTPDDPAEFGPAPGDGATAETTVLAFEIAVPGLTLAVESLHATAAVKCAEELLRRPTTSGQSEVLGLTVNGAHIAVPPGSASIPLGSLGTIVLNAQDHPAEDAISQRALSVEGGPLDGLTLAEASAGALAFPCLQSLPAGKARFI